MKRFPRLFKVLSASLVLGLVLAIGGWHCRTGADTGKSKAESDQDHGNAFLTTQ